MRRIISAIHHESPLMGEALHAALHPATAGFIGLLAVVHQVHKAFEEYHKYLDNISSVGLESLVGSVEKQKKALDDTKMSAEAFAGSLLR